MLHHLSDPDLWTLVRRGLLQGNVVVGHRVAVIVSRTTVWNVKNAELVARFPTANQMYDFTGLDIVF